MPGLNETMAANYEPIGKGDGSSDNTNTDTSLTTDEKLEKARHYKQQGNENYKAKSYKTAIGKYHRALLFLKGIESSKSGQALLTGLAQQPAEKIPEDTLADMSALMCDCYNNLAACILQQEVPNYSKIITYCDQVLDMDSKSVKALYRKGVALYKLHKFDDADSVLQKAVKLPAGAKDGNIKRHIQLCQVELKKQDQKLKNTYKTIFDKMAAQPDIESQ